MNQQGKLYLLPSPLAADGMTAIPAYVLETLHRLTYLVAENAKTTRAFLKQSNTPKPISSFIINELNEHTPASELPGLLAPLLEGNDVGLLSDAGCPGVADPGAALVALAHAKGVEIAPMVGPSSILLALMASGMSGQQFCFHGYLSPKLPDLAKDLLRLEQLASKLRQTQIFIETPYRNQQVTEQALRVLSPDTIFCVAVDLTAATQSVRARRIAEWRKSPPTDLHKRPAVFLIFKN